MNRSRERGISSNSDSGAPHHPNQGNSTPSEIHKVKSEPYRPPQQRQLVPRIVDINSGNSQEMPSVGSFDEQSQSKRGVFKQMVRSSHKGRPVVAASSSDGAMRKGRGGGWDRKQRVVNVCDQEDSSMPVTLKNEPSPDQRSTQLGTVDLSNSLEATIDDSFSKQHIPLPTFSDEGKASYSEQQISAALSESGMGQTSYIPKDASPPQCCDSLHDAQTFNKDQPSIRGHDRVREYKIPEYSRKGMSQSRITSPRAENAYHTIKGHGYVELSKREVSPQRKSPPKRGCTNHIPDNIEDKPNGPFDLFLKKPKTTPKLKPSILEKNREKRKELEHSSNDDRPHMPRPGMVLLKNFITPEDQRKILEKCRDIGLGPGGFYKPGYSDGAKLSLHMMCFGKEWDPEAKYDVKARSNDGAKSPLIPDEFKKLVSEAIKASHVMIKEKGMKYPEKAIPLMEPDICIANFYANTGKLGLHQDKDESDESIKNGLPVVSFSIGDTAEFLYGDDRDVAKAKKIELKSGDVLIFGGKSRLVFHGVPCIIPKTAPKFLVDEVNLRPGRLNLTFRKY